MRVTGRLRSGLTFPRRVPPLRILPKLAPSPSADTSLNESRLTLSVKIGARLGRNLTGWKPLRPEFVDGVLFNRSPGHRSPSSQVAPCCSGTIRRQRYIAAELSLQLQPSVEF